ncbi:MAG TPA: YdeI/OmpD-associated family protein [Opitutaceae bacterium]|nr:YdeI/OmpD-associated family protein [Opitutaceae bacterium]
MPKKDARIDSYIAEAPEFARPILKHLRKIIHQGCPEIVETIKWGSPFFDYKGLLCGFAAFKAHCSLFFWRDIDVGQRLEKTNTAGSGMGQFGRITSLADLPKDDVLLACVRSAVEQRNSPASKIKRAAKPGKELPVPADLKTALGKNKKASATFDNFAPSHRREYIMWITDAKRPETREKRLQTTIEWLSEGKKQNWKYLDSRAATAISKKL